MIVRLLVATMVLGMLIGCDVNPSKMSGEYAEKMANKLTYTFDKRTGLCFAVVTSRKTGDPDQTGLGMTEVPCTDAVKQMIK